MVGIKILWITEVFIRKKKKLNIFISDGIRYIAYNFKKHYWEEKHDSYQH